MTTKNGFYIIILYCTVINHLTNNRFHLDNTIFELWNLMWVVSLLSAVSLKVHAVKVIVLPGFATILTAYIKIYIFLLFSSINSHIKDVTCACKACKCASNPINVHSHKMTITNANPIYT